MKINFQTRYTSHKEQRERIGNSDITMASRFEEKILTTKGKLNMP